MKNISTRYYPKTEDKNVIKSACNVVKFWLEHIEEMEEQGRGLYLWSDAKGSGKTMMITALGNELMDEYGKQVKFATSSDILDEIRASYERQTDTHESKLLSQLVTVDYLIIDDMGVERVTDWVSEKIYTIVNKRYINKKVTFYTSNYDVTDLPYDNRVGNRIKERCFVMHFPETSARDLIAVEHEKELKGE